MKTTLALLFALTVILALTLWPAFFIQAADHSGQRPKITAMLKRPPQLAKPPPRWRLR